VIEMIEFFCLFFLCHPVSVCEGNQYVRIIYTCSSQQFFHTYPLYHRSGENYDIITNILCTISKIR
jgi:hypothetical protein